MRQQRSYSTDAIILKRTDLGETDQILTLFTPAKGKFHAVAKGIRRPISKMGGHLDMLKHSLLQIAQGRNLDIVTQAVSRESFQYIQTSLWHMTCGFYLAELIDRSLEDGAEHFEIYMLLLETLRALDADAAEVQQKRQELEEGKVPDKLQERMRSTLLLRYFELHLLADIGYEPTLQTCASCSNELQPVENGFQAALGGALCPDCSHLWSRTLSLNALKVLRGLQSKEWSDVPHFRVGPRLQSELEVILHDLLRFNLERDMKSWDFLQMLR